ncbi:MAG: response regulator [Plectolyngbya sp. WJT66-NPBG17]|jgi:signal transduction histidine kinase/CheY-like chemotaxis protein|nr:response regulator [Plectolyngbya sp. WJT66-NPBG17]MBW4527272.1 response regulator [Phormidium tanganyikae FI6-MK23]
MICSTEELEQAQTQFALLDQIPLGNCVLRADNVVLFWNGCLEDWTKIPRRDILGRLIAEFFPHFDQPNYVRRFQQVFQGGAPTIFSSQFHQHLIPAPLPQGGNRIQHTTVTATLAPTGKEFYALLSVQDVTELTTQAQNYRKMRDSAISESEERRRAQQSAETANRVKDEFLAVVSHELRTPLNPILGWAKLLQNGKVKPASVNTALATIERNAQLQSQLIDDLLDVSRILRGKLHLDWQTINLSFVVHAALETANFAAEAKSLSIQLHIEEPVAPIKGDPTRLQQIVWNLLSNAVKFTPAHGRIEIYLDAAEAEVQLRVSDTGIGIPNEFLPYVFDSFRQADSTSTRAISGLGLGLSITRHLVELHGGTIKVASLGENQGSTFTLRLPIHKEVCSDDVLACVSSVAPDTLTLEGVHVLVVDDEADTRAFLAFLLEEYGAEVTLAASAIDALLSLKHIRPDVLVSDLGMPQVDGYMLIQQVRALPAFEHLPAIALTAYAAETTQQQVLSAGFQKHLAKPADPTTLIAMIIEQVSSSSRGIDAPIDVKLDMRSCNS